MSKKKYISHFNIGTFFPKPGFSESLQTEMFLFLRKNESISTNNNNLVEMIMKKFKLHSDLSVDVEDFIELNSR